NHLKTHDYFAAGHLTVADIAMYGYTHVANQCDFDLSGYPSVRKWLKRVEQEPRFVSMIATVNPANERTKDAIKA
ncbi:MAG: glutathione binding-like protein, partial [Afipia sp.]|nr:glutathione binding-like protein [Afipia sp.]